MAGENAICQSITLNNPLFELQAPGDATKVLTVNGNITINAGAFRFDDGNPMTPDGTIYIQGTWTNNSSSTPFICGNSTVIFQGNSQSIQSPSLGYENFHNITISSPAVVNPGPYTLNISGSWTNYSSTGFTENTSEVVFNGNALQTISTPGGENFYNLTINNPSAGVGLSTPVTVAANLNLSNGYLAINSSTLTLNGDLTRINGSFRGTSASSLIINGSGSLSAGLMFENSYQTLGTLTLNRTSSGWAWLLSDLTTTTGLNMTAGELDLNHNTLGINGTITGTGQINGTNNSSISVGGTGNAGTIYFDNFNNILSSFTMNRSSGNITLGAPNLRIENQLTLNNGKITTGSNWIIVNSSSPSSVSGQNANSYINGNLRRNVGVSGSYDFPVGTATYYEAANLNFHNNPSASYVDVWFNSPHVTPLDISSLGLSINGTPITTLLDYGFWTFLPSGAGVIDYDITVTSRGHGNGGPLADQHTVVKRAGNFTNWMVFESNHNNGTQSGTGSSPITASLSHMTTFCDVAIARSAINPLPVELNSFKATKTENEILLEWETLSEIENDYFTILKSNDSKNFVPIGSVEGAGFSSTPLFYSFIDKMPLKGMNYYQLRQYDFNGNSDESEIVAVVFEEGSSFAVYSSNGLLSVFGENVSDIQDVRIYDITGREVPVYKTTASDYQYYTGMIPGQVYLVHLISSTGTSVQKIVGW